MALLTYQWQPPSFDSLIANALHGQQQQRLLAIQELEQERLARQKATDLAMQLRQEQRIADSEHFKQQLETAQESRRAAESADKLRPSSLPLFSEVGGTAATPSMPSDAPAPDMAGSLSADQSAQPYNPLLASTDTQTLPDQLSLDNPVPFKMGLEQQNPVAERGSVAMTHQLAVDPMAHPPADFIDSEGNSAPVDAPGDPAALPDFASMMRDQGGIPAVSGGGGSGGDSMPEGNTGGSMDMVDAIRRGEGLPPGSAPAGSDLASQLRGLKSQLDPEAQARVDTETMLERAGKALKGSGNRQLQAELAELRLRGRKTGATAAGAKVKYTYSDQDGNLYSQMTDGSWLEGKAAPPGSKRVGVEGKPAAPEQSHDEYLSKNYSDGDLQVVTAPNGAKVYQRADGTRFQLKKGVTGRWGEVPLHANAEAVKLVQATDGLKYRVGADGNPIDPLPDGVALGDKPKFTHVPQEGVYITTLGPDGKYKNALIIPEGVGMSQADKDKYTDAVVAVHDAQQKLDGVKAAAAQDPSADRTLFGSSKTAKAQAELDAAQEQVESMYVRYKQLRAVAGQAAQKVNGTPPPAPAATPSATPAPSTPAPAADTFPNEAAARAAGHKTGDIVMVVNPKTGRPARARLD